MHGLTQSHRAYKSHILTKDTLTVITDGHPLQIKSTEPDYDTVVNLIRSGRFEEAVSTLDKVAAFESYTRGIFRFRGSDIYLAESDEKLPPVLGARMVNLMDSGVDFTPLKCFWERLKKNPDPKVVQQAFAFLERNHATFTEEGKLLLYKKVNADFSASHKDKQGNPVYWHLGTTVSMPREQCDPNAEQTCSYGLHAAAFGYAKNFEGSVVVEVEVDPEHIVAIPSDYDHQKMRCCEAFVRGVNSGSEWKFHVISADNKDVTGSGPLRPEEAKFLKHGKVRITPAIDRYIAIPPYALRAIGIGAHDEVTIIRVSSNHRNIRLGKRAAVSVPENLRTSGTKEFTVTADARGGCRIRLTTLKEVGLADKPAYTISLSEGNAISVSAVTSKK